MFVLCPDFCFGILFCFLLGFGNKGGDLESVHKFRGRVGVVHADTEFLRVWPEDVGTVDFFRVGVYHVIHISVCVVFDFVDYIPDSKGAGAFMDDDLVFLCVLDFGVGGRPAEKRIILCHDF